MSSFEAGAVYLYNYLWAREQEKGEESGRKSRPSCLVLRSSRTPAELYLFPITSSRPAKERVYLEISAFEGRRVGLSQPSWIILDEFNITLETRTYDFTSTEPKGKFSPTFLATLAETIRATLSRGDVAPVKRN